MKPKIYIICLAVFSAIALSAGTLSVDDSQEFLEKRTVLVVREIGHQLLQHAGDFTSRVLPVKKIDKNTFQLEFQSKFAFVPDSLVKIVHQRLSSANLPPDYMVNVYNCVSPEIVFGYEIRSKNSNVMACMGRPQIKDRYRIQIQFTGGYQASNTMNLWWAVGFVLAGGTLFSLFNKKLLKKKSEPDPVKPTIEDAPSIGIGKYAFYPDRALLKQGQEQVELSDKEAKLLGIFATNQNQVIERDRLLKEVWEDEGVFVVGRSLDVFVSKLRKKLQGDESIRITSIHGKGYKLEVVA
ncbi:winged helix-turn-helix domain-containing protein [Emticicia agri]|uniref:Winged helix family transcriptional regulator n=1 Tax=Emticicia agri TaxID=2492393 RepID=A0A4Q5M5L0_9BACT|nr:winged helix-turn-helix domain-containing protein [Emticicia agri]RYU97724.1 winged helix family transcriptional regulator [Emticicia agri]